MAFIEPMHRNKPNIIYSLPESVLTYRQLGHMAFTSVQFYIQLLQYVWKIHFYNYTHLPGSNELISFLLTSPVAPFTNMD